MQDLVFDTSIFFALIHLELKHQRVEKLLQQAQNNQLKIYASEISLLELEYSLIREEGSEKAQVTMGQVQKLTVNFYPISREVLKYAAWIKVKGKISLGDCIIAATAFKLQLPLLTKDPEFLTLKGEIKVKML